MDSIRATVARGSASARTMQATPNRISNARCFRERAECRPSVAQLDRLRGLPRDVDVDVRRLQRSKEAHPEREEHLESPRGADVAQVDDVPPPKGSQELGDLRLCGGVVSGDEH